MFEKAWICRLLFGWILIGSFSRFADEAETVEGSVAESIAWLSFAEPTEA